MFITGYSLRAPSSSNPRDFYEALRDGKEMTTPTQRYPAGYLGLPPRTGTIPNIHHFDQDFFKFSTKQTEKLDVAIRLLLEVTHEALMDAQLPIEQLRGSKTGVYVGHCFSDFLGRSTCDQSLTGYELVNGAHAMAANKISFFYDFKGPSMAIDTACSSSLVALSQAVSDIRLGVIDRAVVCGLSLTLDPRKNAIFNAFTMLSPDGRCYTFDTRANGYCRSEGVVSVVLESERVRASGGLCRVLGTSVNSDGFKDKGITFPSGKDQAANALAALASSGVDPSSVTYVEAHGTGTVAGDKQELDGLSRAFYGDAATGPEAGGEGDAGAARAEGRAFRRIPVGSVKSAMGHAEGASGLISVVKCLAMFEHKQLLPNQNFESTAHPPLLDGRFRVVTQVEDWAPGNVCISNYGFGGTNAFAVLGPADHHQHPSGTRPPLPAPRLLLPATHKSLCFSNAATTKFDAGAVDHEWLAQQVALGNDASFKFRGGKKVGSKGGYDKVCFVYGGQGSQWPRMGQRLMQECPEFRATIARLGGYLKDLDASLDLCALFEAGEEWMNKRFTVLGIGAYQIAATNLLADAGLVPDFYMGHSLGETAAGYARGLQTEEETIKIAYVRSSLSAKIKPGGFVLKSASPRPSSSSSSPGSSSSSSFAYPLLCTSQGFWFYDVPAADVQQARKGSSGSSSSSSGGEGDEGSGDALAANLAVSEELGEALFDNAGQMVAVGLPSDVVNDAIAALELKQTCVACFNGPAGQTVSGAATEVAKLKEHLLSAHGEGLFWREVDTDGVAYHAPHLSCYFDFLVAEFEKILGSGAARELDGKWLPTSVKVETGGALSAGGTAASSSPSVNSVKLDANFHARNITSPVYFMNAIQALPPNTLVLEVGSAQSLLGQVKRVRSDVGLAGLAVRGEPASEEVYLSSGHLKAALWEAGFARAFPAPPLLVDATLRSISSSSSSSSSGAWPTEVAAPVVAPSVVRPATAVAAASLFQDDKEPFRAVAGKEGGREEDGEEEEEKAPRPSPPSPTATSSSSSNGATTSCPAPPRDAPAVPAVLADVSVEGQQQQQQQKQPQPLLPQPGAQPSAPLVWELPRLPFGFRWPDLWDHSRQQRVFTYRDFELKFQKDFSMEKKDALGKEEEEEGVSQSAGGSSEEEGAQGGQMVAAYDLVGKDAFLMDHRVNGRALFPATGHLYTMWVCALASSSSSPPEASSPAAAGAEFGQGVRFTDFEILTAVVLDPVVCPEVKFSVAQVDGVLTVLYQGGVVARARFELLPPDFEPHPGDKPHVPPNTLAAAAAATAAATASGGKLEGSAKLDWLERGQLYNHFKRYGYEYQDKFQLVTRRTVPLRLEGSSATTTSRVGCGVLRPAEHVIPFLDNFLQLVLEDLSMLQLPTLIRECELLPGAAAEALGGACVAVESASGSLASKSVTMRGVHTMPAAGPLHPPLTHHAHAFVALGTTWRSDDATLAAFEATRRFTANAITAHCAANLDAVASKPWLKHVLGHAKQWVVAPPPSVDEALYATSLHYRMHVDLYADTKVQELLEHPFLTLSLHAEHDAFYEANTVVASSDAELAGLVGLVRKEWHGVDALSVFEGGAGSCGFTRRVVPLLGEQLGAYTVSDISAIRLGTLAGHPKIKSVKHDLNNPLAHEHQQQHHLILANNAIHTASDVARTLAYFRDGLVEGGMVLLEEQITDACLYLWGLDNFIWETATDKRSFGLWMSWDEWQVVIDGCEGMELLCCHHSPYHLTMLLRKTTTTTTPTTTTAAAPLPMVSSWADVAASLSSPASPGAEAGAEGKDKANGSSSGGAVVVAGAGAEGLVKTLRLEQGAFGLKALVDVDGTAAQALGVATLPQTQARSSSSSSSEEEAAAGASIAVPAAKLPLTFNHVKNGQVGSLVAVPLALKDAIEPPTTKAAAASSGGPPPAAAAGQGNVQLHIVRPGDLSTLTWIEAPATPEFSVKVAYSSLNFKDVMYAFGKLRLESPSFGLEFSGHDVGSGKAVMGIGTSACIAKRAKPTLCWDVPEGLPLDQAATIPVVYATALFALFEKARLRKGQSVLVHAGSGGVGHAAIYLCQARGIEVFTTCSEGKRQYVLDTFGLDDAHVSSSRDKSFREAVLRATGGQGVDCVLNSLSGSLLEPSLQCVKAFGHFCEIGKYDLQNNTRVGLKALERNVSYHAIDLATMFAHPHLSVVLKELVEDALAQKHVVPLPLTAFEAGEVEHALRFVSAGKHRGKVVVDMRDFTPSSCSSSSSSGAAAGGGGGGGATADADAAPPASPSSAPAPPATLSRFSTSGTHVITGGLGGFGLELAKWLLEQGATKVVATGRSGITMGWQRYRAEAIWAKFGRGALEVSNLNVCDLAQCRELLAHADNGDDDDAQRKGGEAAASSSSGSGSVGGGGALKGVWHVAMVLHDTLFKNMTPERWDAVNAVKVQGLRHLDAVAGELLPPAQLDAFVAFSSVSSLFGNVGQANYAHANAACESLVKARNAAGLVGCAVQWGMIDNVGFFGANDAKVLETFLGLQNVDASLHSLHSLVPAGGVVTSYRFAGAPGGADGEDGGAAGGAGGEAFELSLETIQAKVAEILGGSGSDYDVDSPLNDYGLDSLSSIEVVNWMSRHTTQSVNPSFMTADMTISKMHAHMAANLKVAS